MLNSIPIIGTAYIIIFLGVILKAFSLYALASKKDNPIQERKRIYLRLNIPANILIVLGVIILAMKWYL